MPLARHPLHRSGRAELPHPAPTLGDNAKTHERVGMADARAGKPSVDQTPHPGPVQVVALTAPPQSATPDPSNRIQERLQGRAVERHPVVTEVPTQDPLKTTGSLRPVF